MNELTNLDRRILVYLTSEWEEHPTHHIAWKVEARERFARGSMRRLFRLGFVTRRTNPERPIEYLYRANPVRCRELLNEVRP